MLSVALNENPLHGLTTTTHKEYILTRMNAEAEFQMKDTALNCTIAQIVGMCRY